MLICSPIGGESRTLSLGDLLQSNEIRHKKAGNFDPSCRGMYKPELFDELDMICKSCYNLYRAADVEVECR